MVAVDRVEQCPLARIGVLELVDQRDRPLRVQAIGQRRAPAARRRGFGMHACNQVVEGELFAFGQARLAPGREHRQHASCPAGAQDEVAPRHQRGRRACEGRDRVREAARDMIGVELFAPELGVGQFPDLGVGRGRQRSPFEPVREFAETAAQGALLAIHRQGRGEVAQSRRPGRIVEQGAQWCDVAAERGQSRRHRRLQQLRPRLGRHAPQRREATGFVLVAIVRQPARQVVEQFVAQRLVRHQFADAQGRSRGQRLLGQHALAQRMQGRDRGTIEFGQRALQAPADLIERGPCDRLAEAAVDLGLVRVGVGGPGATPQRPLQAGTDAFPQLRRGGVGEGRDDDGIRAQAVFDDQAQVQHRDRPGLAGAGAGLDEDAPVRRRLRIEREFAPVGDLGHAAPPSAPNAIRSRSIVAVAVSRWASALAGSTGSAPRASSRA